MIKIPDVEKILVEQLKTDGQNPYRLSPKEMDRLMQSIRKLSFIVPIVTNRELLIAS